MLRSCLRRVPEVLRERFARPRARLAAWLVGIVVAFGGYLALVATSSSFAASGSDPSGYLNIVRQLEQGLTYEHVPVITGVSADRWNLLFQQPLGYRVEPDSGTRVTTYPVGYPLHLLALSWWIGREPAALVVSWGMAVAAALLMFALGRELGLPRSWSVAGGVLLLGCPLFFYYELQPMSDVPATVWSMATVWLVLRSRRAAVWAFAVGAALAVAVLIRPTNVLLLAPVAVIFGLDWRRWLRVVLGGLPGAVFLAAHNQALYGRMATTGYGDVSSLFGWQFLLHNAAHFAWWIPALLSPAVALPALFWPWLRSHTLRLRLLLSVWAGAFVLFYLFYYHSGETWWYLRFILPAFPALILAGLLAAQSLSQRWQATRWGRVGLAVALLAALAWQLQVTRALHVRFTKDEPVPYLKAVEWMRTNAPSDALVLQMQLSGCFTYYADFTIVRYDLIGREGWATLQQAAQRSERAIYATLFEFEESVALRERVPGPWRLIHRDGRLSIWRLAGHE